MTRTFAEDCALACLASGREITQTDIDRAVTIGRAVAAGMGHVTETPKSEHDARDVLKALRDCLEWMEEGRGSGDWGYWDWSDGDVYTRARAALAEYEARG